MTHYRGDEVSQDQQIGWLFDVQKTKERYTFLEAYYNKHGLNADTFSCRCYGACSGSQRNPQIVKQYSGGTAGLAPFYDASYGGRPIRVLVVGKETGFINNPLGTAANFHVQTLNNLNCINWQGKNNHIRGTLLTLQNIFEVETEYVYAAYALSNALRCAFQDPDRAGSRSGLKDTATMRRNCLEHLIAEIKILEPTVIILQGERFIGSQPSFIERLGAAIRHTPAALQTFGTAGYGLYRVGPIMCIASQHPAILPDWLANMAPKTLWPMILHLKKIGYLPKIGSDTSAEFERLVKPDVDKIIFGLPSNDMLRNNPVRSSSSLIPKAVSNREGTICPTVSNQEGRAVDPSRSSKAYWINQAPTNISIWARFKDRRHQCVPHWERLRAMMPGDIIVHNVNRCVRRVSRVVSHPVNTSRPRDIIDKNDPHFQDIGTLVEIETVSLPTPVKLDDFVEALNDMNVEGGPIRSDGVTVMLGYAFNFPIGGLRLISERCPDKWPDWAIFD